MFGTANKTFGGTTSFGTFGSTSSTTNTLGLGTSDNPMKDVEVQAPPDDTVSALKFSPKADFLIASSWANDVSSARHFCGSYVVLEPPSYTAQISLVLLKLNKSCIISLVSLVLSFIRLLPQKVSLEVTAL